MAFSKSTTKVVTLLLLTAAVMLLGLFAGRTSVFETLEMKTLDYRFRMLGQQDGQPQDIVLAEIDDNSIKHLEPAFGRWPWSREVHSYFLRFMARARAKVVAYDVLFLEHDTVNPDGDALFARQTRSNGNVVQAVYLGGQDNEQITGEADPALIDSTTLPGTGNFSDFIQVDFPYPELAAASASIGHVANVLDSDGPFRHYLVMAQAKHRLFPSLALAVALKARGLSTSDLAVGEREVIAGGMRIPLNGDWRLPIWYNGGPGTYPSYPYSHIVYSELQIEQGETPGLEPALFRDKIVMVGVSATGLHDLFTTPYAGSAGEAATDTSGLRLGKMGGVEVHANVVDDLLHGRFLVDPPHWLNLLIGVLITLGVIGSIFYLRLFLGATISLALLGAYLFLVQAVFSSHHLRLPVVAAVFAWSLAVAFSLAYQYWIEGAEKRAVKTIFSRYVSRDVFKQLMDNPNSAQLGGRRMVVTVLFSDLRGFTTLSEHRAPEDIVAILNEYFSAMVEVVFKHQGTIDKFVGDMIMALFNAPLPDAQHADHAVQCALAMQRRLAELNRNWAQRGMPALACGVGINTGDMIAGNVGAESIRSYTVIGDNVNLGSRLESLCKEYKVSIIISENTRICLKENYDLVELGDVLVKGKSQPVKIFHVRDPNTLETST